MKASSNATDMTSGNITRQLVRYSIPILLGELFQQFYNTVDAIILGNFVSFDAMAAVGGTSNVTKLLVGFFNGISLGCTVVIAMYFGEKNQGKLRKSVHTIVYMALILSSVLSLFGVAISSSVLKLCSMPESIMPQALSYVKIYFGGLLTLVLYNTITGILRGVETPAAHFSSFSFPLA